MPLRARIAATAGVVAALLAAPGGAAEPGRFSHAEFDGFVRRHVDANGRVDYAAAKGDRADLDRYLAALAQASPDSHPERFPTPDDRLAYWINAYNAAVIAAVLPHYPIASVRDVPPPRGLFFLPGGFAFFTFQGVVLGGREVSLRELEHDVIRGRFDEPRVHFALNCASRGCPRLPAAAFSAERLDAELAREALFFVREPRNVRADPDARVLKLSQIFEWYEADFVGRPGGPATLAEYIASLLPPDEARALRACAACRIEFIPYDWRLNDRAEPGDRPEDQRSSRSAVSSSGITSRTRSVS
jgi:hypothetical protein